MQRGCALHLGPVRGSEVEHSLICKSGVRKLMCCMEDATQPQRVAV